MTVARATCRTKHQLFVKGMGTVPSTFSQIRNQENDDGANEKISRVRVVQTSGSATLKTSSSRRMPKSRSKKEKMPCAWSIIKNKGSYRSSSPSN